MKLPDFLIIGAMKSGTTTLYRDLLTNPAVYMPADKEPGHLCHDEVLTEQGTREYADLFRFAREDQCSGEASTNYSKIPRFNGVPERARKVCGERLRVFYIVREPVARIISHHYHMHAIGMFGPDINEEVRKQSILLDYTRYATQIVPWMDTFGEAQVRPLIFEEYIRHRRETIAEISGELGIAPRPELVDERSAYNRSDRKHGRPKMWQRLWATPVYRRYIQPRLPSGLRDRMRTLLYPKAPPRPAPPTPETVDYLIGELGEEMDRFQRVLGRSEPIWDLREVREKHTLQFERFTAAAND